MTYDNVTNSAQQRTKLKYVTLVNNIDNINRKEKVNSHQLY